VSVDILIPNLNGREALELCIESIARYTLEPHRVIVYDDGSGAGDVEYLGRARARGWVDLVIRREEQRGHGAALNVLVNEAAINSDYAAIVDNDVQILRSGWLSELLALAERPHVLAACDANAGANQCWRGWRPPTFLFWFGMLNMSAYRDGMQTNWARPDDRVDAEPWRSLFSGMTTVFKPGEEFDPGRVVFDPGSAFWAKWKYENPKGYSCLPLTSELRGAFRHISHGQHWLDPDMSDTPKAKSIRAYIDSELKRLREGK